MRAIAVDVTEHGTGHPRAASCRRHVRGCESTATMCASSLAGILPPRILGNRRGPGLRLPSGRLAGPQVPADLSVGGLLVEKANSSFAFSTRCLAPLPGVDVGADLAGALPPRFGVLVEEHLDPAACVG